MGRKRKIEASKEGQMGAIYPATAVFSTKKRLSENDKAFILLLYSGCNSVTAYRVAYRPNASAHSIATMAYRLKMEEWVEDAFRNLRRYRPFRGYDYKDII